MSRVSYDHETKWAITKNEVTVSIVIQQKEWLDTGQRITKDETTLAVLTKPIGTPNNGIAISLKKSNLHEQVFKEWMADPDNDDNSRYRLDTVHYAYGEIQNVYNKLKTMDTNPDLNNQCVCNGNILFTLGCQCQASQKP